MGQKVNPIGFRLAVNKDWRSKWYAEGEDYTNKLHEDLTIRKYIAGRLQAAALAKVIIERAWNSVRVTLHTSRPGLVIGRKGSEIEIMTNEISKIAGGSQVKIDIVEIRKPELDSQCVCEQVCIQLERRIAFRRAMKRAVQTAWTLGRMEFVSAAPVVSVVLISLVPSGIAKGRCLSRPFESRLTMDSRKPRPFMALLA